MSKGGKVSDNPFRPCRMVEIAGLEPAASRVRLQGQNRPSAEGKNSSDNAAGDLQDICKSGPDLAVVVEAWPDLPEAVKRGILAIVKASTKPRR